MIQYLRSRCKEKKKRLSIERFEPGKEDDVVNLSDDDNEKTDHNSAGKQLATWNRASFLSGKREILFVAVVDNGCGMNGIQSSAHV